MARSTSYLPQDRGARRPRFAVYDDGVADAGTGRLATRGKTLISYLHSMYRLYNSEVMHRLHHAGYSDIRQVHTGVLKVIDLGGTRLTDVAARCNITKQAAGQVVKELVALNYMSLMTLPGDTRVRMVVFNERGIGLLIALSKIFEEIDAGLATIIGAAGLMQFERDLHQLTAGFPEIVATNPNSPDCGPDLGVHSAAPAALV